MDNSKVSCRACAELFESEGNLPVCAEDRCEALIDQLSDDTRRLLNVRGILITLNEIGLGAQAAASFELSQEDMFTLAWIEMELKSLQPQPEAK